MLKRAGAMFMFVLVSAFLIAGAVPISGLADRPALQISKLQMTPTELRPDLSGARINFSLNQVGEVKIWLRDTGAEESNQTKPIEFVGVFQAGAHSVSFPTNFSGRDYLQPGRYVLYARAFNPVTQYASQLVTDTFQVIRHSH